MKATERARAVTPGWFAGPVYQGDYPQLLKGMVGDRLPIFTDAEKELIRDSSDFYGLNMYTTNLVREWPFPRKFHGDSDLGQQRRVVQMNSPEWSREPLRDRMGHNLGHKVRV